MIENCYYVMYEFHLLPDGRSRQKKTHEGRILGAFVFESVGLLPVNPFAVFWKKYKMWVQKAVDNSSSLCYNNFSES